MKKTIVILLILLVGAGAWLYLTEPENPANQQKIPFKFAKVKQGELLVKISATGVVEPNFQVEVKSKASGEVLSFPFEEGDRVQQEQLLMELDKSDELRNVGKAQADLDSALARLKKSEIELILQKTKFKSDVKSAQSRVLEMEANLKEADDQLKRQQNLFKEGVISRETLDTAETQRKVQQELLIQARSNLEIANNSVHDIAVRENEIELARADVKRAEITLEEARERLSETEIFAPISGTLIEKMVERGQIISSGISNVSGGTALSNLADVSRLFIIADVDETDIGKVKKGLSVVITTDAYPDQKFKGKVARIAPKGIVENSITVFKVKIEILGKGKSILKPMMSANVDIISKRLKNVLYLPREAVKTKDDKDFVGILVGDEPKEVEVSTGAQNPIVVEIKSGLNKGQEVLAGDWQKLVEEFKNNKDKMSTMKRIIFMLSRR